MYAQERQQRIAEIARAAGRVEVSALAEDLDVTPETVRRDLTVLERAGLLSRVHGGAIPVERLGLEPALAARDEVMQAEKERIAKAALEEVGDAGSLLLDAGTTTARLVDVLPDREITVVTTSLALATSLASRRSVTVLALGGRVRGRTLAAVGDWALRSLAELHADVAVLGTNGFSVAGGLTTPDADEAAVKAAMLRACTRAVVVADHTKAGRDALVRFGGLQDVDVLVTDTGLDAATAAELETAGPRVVRA